MINFVVCGEKKGEIYERNWYWILKIGNIFSFHWSIYKSDRPILWARGENKRANFLAAHLYFVMRKCCFLLVRASIINYIEYYTKIRSCDSFECIDLVWISLHNPESFYLSLALALAVPLEYFEEKKTN